MSGRSGKRSCLDSLLSKKLQAESSALGIEVKREPSTTPTTASSPSPARPSPTEQPAALVGGCRPCQTYFRCPRQLLVHLAQHMPDVVFLCPDVVAEAVAGPPPVALPPPPPPPRPPPQPSPLVQRKERTSLNYYMCSQCSATFETRLMYEAHMLAHSADTLPTRASPAVFKCSDCPSSFTDINQYQEHNSSAHGQRFTESACPTCGETFNTTFELNRHQGSHTGGSHLCQKCGRCFRSRKTLHSHVREHASASPGAVVCEDCGASFPDELALELHSRSLHPESKPLSCSFCDARFPFRRDLEAHVQKDHYLESFAIGGGSFKAGTSRGARESSVKSESGSSRGSDICPECGDIFDTRKAFVEHKKTHIGGKDREDLAKSGHSYPKYRAVSHNMSNDYLNGLLEGIVQRQHTSPPKRSSSASRNGLPGSEGEREEMVSSTTMEQSNSEHSPSPDAAAPQPEAVPSNISPLQNQYFRGLVETNVKKYSRQRIKDPLADYMTTTNKSSSMSPSAQQ